jgi:two-component system, cell cycle sensor histidine kinase and response regulator CckA
MVEEIHNAGTRATALTRQLLAFSRRQVLHPVVLDLNRLVTAMETMLRRLIGENIEITTSLLPGLGRVKADPTQIEQILMNLAVNSRDAMPRGGTIAIKTNNVELDDIFALRHPDVKPGSYVLLSVRDSGVGMDPETQVHIFEPFFTTKKPGKGTGLGLSTVYGIVKQSAGHVEAESELDSGTTFRVYLPCVKDEAEAPSLLKALSLVGGGETILLVEDSAPLRELVQEMLAGLGYNVLAFGRPLEAIRSVERYVGPIALLVTDVVMPEINGRVLAETLVRARPEMKVLYTSGYASDTCVDQGEIDVGSPLLEKPFTRDILARRVRELLDSVAS